MVRLISGVLLAAAALAAILFLPVLALRVLACLVAALAAHEYSRIVGIARGASEVLVLIAVVAVCWRLSAAAPLDTTIVLLAAFAWVALEVLWLGRTMPQAAAAVLAPVYIAVPLALLVLVHASRGARATLLLIATVVVSDSAQYYTGRTVGRRPLAPAISPKKTIEGAAGGVVFGMLFMSLLAPSILMIDVWRAALFGAVLVLLGICGDLFESRLKRLADVKDSSSLIPGHGGVLDRIDALLFVAPAFYLYLRDLS